MGGTHSTYEEGEDSIQNFRWRTQREDATWEM